MDISHLLFSFEGRINRAKWWLGVLILWVAQLVVLGIAAFAVGGNQDTFLIVQIIVSLIFIYPALALYAKRWHDRNKSGWWTAIILIPIVGAIWMLIECGILKGTDGPNNYGPDPLQ